MAYSKAFGKTGDKNIELKKKSGYFGAFIAFYGPLKEKQFPLSLMKNILAVSGFYSLCV